MKLQDESQLFERLLIASGTQAEQLLERYSTSSTTLERTAENLGLSPLLDKQLLGTALRFAQDLCLSGAIRSSLLIRFRSPAPGVAIEAQRRVVETEVEENGLPMALAADYVKTLIHRIDVTDQELPEALWEYAALYDHLWCDPRICAGTPTRTIMIAMATVLRSRSAELNAIRNKPSGTMPSPPRAEANLAAPKDLVRVEMSGPEYEGFSRLHPS